MRKTRNLDTTMWEIPLLTTAEFTIMLASIDTTAQQLRVAGRNDEALELELLSAYIIKYKAIA